MRRAISDKLTTGSDSDDRVFDTGTVAPVAEYASDADSVNSSIARLTEIDPAQRWQDTSSWMTSLILHLICFLLITSISVPWAAQGGSGSREGLTLTMGFAETEQDADGRSQSISIEPSTETDSAEQQTSEPAETPSRPPPSPQSEPQRAQNRRRQQPQAKRARSPSMFGKWVEKRMSEPIVPDSSSQYAAILNRKRENVQTSAVPAQLQTANLASAEILDAEQIRYDKVVDEFIKYDIGQLRGKAGQAGANAS